jgi:5-(carboxyamino)imidazole ribonucleotide mutase
MEGFDSLLSIVQMPAGIPVATFAIGEAGAKNAALFAIALLAAEDEKLARKLDQFRSTQTKVAAESILEAPKKLSRRSH